MKNIVPLNCIKAHFSLVSYYMWFSQWPRENKVINLGSTDCNIYNQYQAGFIYKIFSLTLILC